MKKLLYTVTVLLSTISLHAQENDSTITRTITVEREFMPTIESSGKIHTQPKVFTPQIAPKTIHYTDVAKPFVPENQIDAFAHAQASFAEPVIDKGYLRGGIGFWNGLFDFGYLTKLSKSAYIDLSAHHDGVYGLKQYGNSTMNMEIGKQFRKTLLTVGINGQNEFFNYYGAHFNDSIEGHYNQEAMKLNDSINNRFWNVGAHIAFQSLPETSTAYKVKVGYQLFNAEAGLSEHQINVHTNVSWKFQSGTLGGNFSAQNLLYNNSVTGINYPSHHIIHLEPYYSFSNKSITTHIGINFDFSLLKGLYFAPSPRIDFEWRIKPKFFAIYAQVDGEYKINTMQKSMLENRYLNPLIHLTDTLAAYTPLNATFGTKIKPFKDLIINAHIGYKYTYNDYYYTPVDNGRFGIAKSNSSNFSVGGSAEYHYKNRLRMELAAQYMAWNLAQSEYNWDRPSWKAHFITEVNVTEKLHAFANCYFIGERMVNMGNEQPYLLKPIIDLNVGVSYSFNNWFSLFANLNNLIHNQQGQFYGYETQGFNFLLGAAWRF